jgi:hypothetical protein
MAIFADGLLDSASLHIGSLSAVSILELISRHTEYAAEASDALALLAGADMVHGHYASAQQRLTSAKSFATQLAGRRKNGAWATALYARVTKDAAAELAALREATGAIDKLEQGDDIYSFWRLADAEKAAGSFRDGYRTLQTLWKKLGELPAVPTDDLAESDLRLARAAFAAGEQEAAAIAARGLANAELVSGFLDPVRLSEAAAIIALAGDASGDPDASHWARLARWHAAAALFEEPRLRFLRSHELILANLAAKPAPGAGIDGFADAPAQPLPQTFSPAAANGSLDSQQAAAAAARVSYDDQRSIDNALSALADLRASKSGTVDGLELRLLDEAAKALRGSRAGACDDFIEAAEFVGLQAPRRDVAARIDAVFAGSGRQISCSPLQQLRMGATRIKIGDPIEEAIARVERLVPVTALVGRLPADHPLADAIVELSESIARSGAGNLRYRLASALPLLFAPAALYGSKEGNKLRRAVGASEHDTLFSVPYVFLAQGAVSYAVLSHAPPDDVASAMNELGSRWGDVGFSDDERYWRAQAKRTAEATVVTEAPPSVVTLAVDAVVTAWREGRRLELNTLLVD